MGQYQTEIINELNPYYDALQYPILFWAGQSSYHVGLREIDDRGQRTNKKVSMMDFYSFHMMLRDNQLNYFLMCMNLLNQFIVDAYAKIESQRLSYLRNHQADLRADQYNNLRDALADDRNPAEIGRRVILPSTFTGGPRNMHELAQDAIAYCKNYGRPTLFITMTCNPQWPEIQVQLNRLQQAIHRNDIVARVFQLKVKKLVEVITKGRIFGPVISFLYTIEWQKRGLPHCHMLIWLKNRIRPEDINSIISAELPDPEEDAALSDVIRKCQIHGPCDDPTKQFPCRKANRNRCNFRYPRQFVNETIRGEDGYPLYRRRQGQSFQIVRNGRIIVIDNRWVVPYSPTLSRIFKCHLNVEYCHSVKSIKYICKYVYKGEDRAIAELRNPINRAGNEVEAGQPTNRNDEIATFLL